MDSNGVTSDTSTDVQIKGSVDTVVELMEIKDPINRVLNFDELPEVISLDPPASTSVHLARSSPKDTRTDRDVIRNDKVLYYATIIIFCHYKNSKSSFYSEYLHLGYVLKFRFSY